MLLNKAFTLSQLMKKNNPLRKLESQMTSLGSSLEKVNMLLDQRSPTVSEAKRALKVCCVIYCLSHVVVVENCVYFRIEAEYLVCEGSQSSRSSLRYSG